jgi:hypothetical protein
MEGERSWGEGTRSYPSKAGDLNKKSALTLGGEAP